MACVATVSFNESMLGALDDLGRVGLASEAFARSKARAASFFSICGVSGRAEPGVAW